MTPRLLTGELHSINKGTLSVVDKNGITLKVSVTDPRFISGELQSINKGKTDVIDVTTGKIFKISTSDVRFTSGKFPSHRCKTVLAYLDGVEILVSPKDTRFISGEIKLIPKSKN